jgi:hypothetical protein
MADTVIVDSSAGDGGEPSSRIVRLLRGSSWLLAGVFFLLLFTLFKLPDDRIGAYIDGKVQERLRPMGIRYTSQKTRLKFGFGLSYVLESVTVDLSMPGMNGEYFFDRMTISPSLLALLTFKAGADVRLESGKGSADLSARLGKSSQSVSFKLKDVMLGAFGNPPGGAAPSAPVDFFNPNPMSILSALKKSALLNGSGSFSGDFMIPNSLDGNLRLDISKLIIEQQTLAGFALPRMSVSEGKIEAGTEKGKLLFKNVKLGKAGDDLRATLTGDLTLGRTWDSSVINSKVNFALSENVTKALVLVDALLAPGKQSDGSYTYSLSGMLANPAAAPGGK